MCNRYVLLFEEFNAAEEKAILAKRVERLKSRNKRNQERLKVQKDPLRQEITKNRLQIDALDSSKLKLQSNIISLREKLAKEVEARRKEREAKAKK